MSAPFRCLWWLHGFLFMPASEPGYQWPKPWAKALHINGFPWLWCRCGDGFRTWREVRRWECSSCQSDRIWREAP